MRAAESRSTGLRGPHLLLVLAATSACVTPTAVAPKPDASPRPSTPTYALPVAATDALVDARAEQFLRAFRDGDVAAATRNFTPPLRRDMPPQVVAGVRDLLVRAYGPLLSWQVTRSVRSTEGDLREYDLRFERGTIPVGLLFHDKTRNIAELFITPPPDFPSEPTPGTEARVSSVEVKVGPGLGATVTTPRGTGAGRGPWPAVVLVAGFGLLDRDARVGTVRPFRDLAEGLAARGVAAIRFNKRAFVYPEMFANVIFTVEEETIQDALSAIAVLKRQPGVDPARVFVVGHDQGARLAPEIAARGDGVAGIVMLAAPGRPPLDMLLDELKRGHAPRDVIERVDDGRRAVANSRTPAAKYVEGAPVAFWTDLAKRNPFEVARRYDGPILILRGEDDQSVLAVDQEAWIKRLAGRSGLMVKTIPGLCHLFVPTSELVAAESGWKSAVPRVPAGLIDDVAAFVRR